MPARVRRILAALALLSALAAGGCVSGGGGDRPSLAADDVRRILDQAEAAAKATDSLLRVDEKGQKRTTRMQIMVVNRWGVPVGFRSMEDAWIGSISIARSKAFTAAAFSSRENALTSRSVGALSQPGGPLWNIGNTNRPNGIVEFPGGVPLYKDGRLVGAIGVSGDGVDEDETVAVAGAKGFEPPAAIRIDAVTQGKVPYAK